MSNVENQSEKVEEVDDQELEDLLDSAIEDFDKPPPQKNKTEEANLTKELEPGVDDVWGEEFLVEVQKQFEENMKSLLGKETLEDGTPFEPEQFGIDFQKIAQEASKVLNEQTKTPEFTDTIAQTLKNLSENTENLDNDVEANNITAMMEGMGFGENPDLSNEMLPLLQSVMKSFLSKDMLYGPIKEITEKYPEWLKDNKNELNKNDYDNYVKQFQLMEEVCKEFEEEKDNDGEVVKNKRFTKVLGLMEEMQKLGQPPKDLVGEGVPFGLDDNLAKHLPSGIDQSQCSIM